MTDAEKFHYALEQMEDLLQRLRAQGRITPELEEAFAEWRIDAEAEMKGTQT